MFERFTDRAHRVIVLAQEEARAAGRNEAGAEYILLGIIKEGEGVGGLVLAGLGVTYDGVRGQLPVPGTAVSPKPLRFGSDVKRVTEHSLRESLYLGHPYIGTEHLLLALTRSENAALDILVKLGHSGMAVRAAVLEKLGAYEKPPPVAVVSRAGAQWPPSEFSLLTEIRDILLRIEKKLDGG